jgi:hypothetical protein
MDLVGIIVLQVTEEETIDPGVIVDLGVTVDPEVVVVTAVDRALPIVAIAAIIKVEVANDDDTVDLLPVMTVTLFLVNLMMMRIHAGTIVLLVGVRVMLLLVEVVVGVIIKRDQEVVKMIELVKDDQNIEIHRWILIQRMN